MTSPDRVYARQTPEGVELRVDGTLASLMRRGHVTSGPVWNALAAPLLALPGRRLRRILVLGLGAGSVARIARALAPAAHIVGVELDAEVLRQARRHFGLSGLRAEVVLGDARVFLERERRTFDAVVDDVYEGTARALRKPAWMMERYELVTRRVARGGVLIVNTIDETAAMAARLRQEAGTLVRVSLHDYWNHILALGPATLRAPELRRRLRAHPLLAPSVDDFVLRTLRP